MGRRGDYWDLPARFHSQTNENMSDAFTREQNRREFFKAHYAKTSPLATHPDAIQRSFLRRLFNIYREGEMVDGLLVLSNKSKKKLHSHVEAYPFLFGHLVSGHLNCASIENYLRNRREDVDQTLSRDEFLAQMYTELMELLGFELQPLQKTPEAVF